MATILDGAAIAAEIKKEVAAEVKLLAAQGIRPGLAAVLVGNVAASEIYVRSKVQTCADLGIYSELITPPGSVTTEEMMDVVAALNSRDEIDGILIQLPLPAQVDTKALLDAVLPSKDVDGFNPVNAGRLQANRPSLAPCTPAGIIEILKRSGIPIAGRHAVVVGRSDIVGKPAAMLLLHENATVTICHSKTRDLGAITRQADILVAGDGYPRRHHHRRGDQSHHQPRRVRPLLCRRREAGGCLPQARLDAGGGCASQGVCLGRSLYACSWGGWAADDRDADGQYRARREDAQGPPGCLG